MIDEFKESTMPFNICMNIFFSILPSVPKDFSKISQTFFFFFFLLDFSCKNLDYPRCKIKLSTIPVFVKSKRETVLFFVIAVAIN